MPGALSGDDKVDFRSYGGPGAVGFLVPPVLWEDEEVKPMPDQHFQVMLKDRLLLEPSPAWRHLPAPKGEWLNLWRTA